MPMFDHTLDNKIQRKEDLRFTRQDSAEEFATGQYMTDFVPRSVVQLTTGNFIVLENPSHIEHPYEVFFINSTPGD